MSQTFVKGRTNNHLSWVMVDATDFATPESALSAAITYKIYGKLRGAAGVNFVSSGTGSTAGGDIVHVGASATGIYTAPFVKADLSDASAAWYDHYTFIFAGTGAAQQVLVVDGGIDMSVLLAMSGMLSDTHSAAILAASTASEAQSHAVLAASRILLVQSRLSDYQSAVYASDISDIRSMLAALSDAISNVDSAVNSQFAAVTSQLSDFRSDLHSHVSTTGVGLNASTMSDIRSAINALTVSLDASNISDIASAVVAALPISSQVSDLLSMLSDFYSDFQSRVPKLVATSSQVIALSSDVKSAVVVAQSLASDAYSAALLTQSLASDAHSAAAQANSRTLVIESQVSDVMSRLSDVHSDLHSFMSTTGVGLHASAFSDIRSAVLSLSGMLSDAHSAAAAATSQVVLVKSQVSDIYSLLSDVSSDIGVVSGVISDIDSLLEAGVELGASTMSDVRSAITAADGALTDSVPADGALPTVRQALYMLTQFLTERSVSGTTVTVRKVDGATTLMTFTLNDGTTPTSITRTT